MWSEGGGDPMGSEEEPSFGFSERCIGNVGEADRLAGGGSDFRVSLEYGTQDGEISGGIRLAAPRPGGGVVYRH